MAAPFQAFLIWRCWNVCQFSHDIFSMAFMNVLGHATTFYYPCKYGLLMTMHLSHSTVHLASLGITSHCGCSYEYCHHCQSILFPIIYNWPAAPYCSSRKFSGQSYAFLLAENMQFSVYVRWIDRIFLIYFSDLASSRLRFRINCW